MSLSYLVVSIQEPIYGYALLLSLNTVESIFTQAVVG